MAIEITEAMYQAGEDAFYLYDSEDSARQIIWSVYTAMRDAELNGYERPPEPTPEERAENRRAFVEGLMRYAVVNLVEKIGPDEARKLVAAVGDNLSFHKSA